MMPPMDSQAMESPPLAVTTDPKWLAAERVANSRCFQRSSRLRDFLLYVVRYELEGKTGDISEQNIGERVFARRENYSPLDDNIVRVSARQLRLKLKEYYDSDGRDDPWVIEIPKGGYIPTFHAHSQIQEVPTNEVRPLTDQPGHKRGALWLAASLVLAGLMFAIGWGLASRRASTRAKTGPNLVRAIFHQSATPVQIVLSDSALTAMENMLGRSFSVDEYSDESYRPLPPSLGSPQDAAVWNTLASQQVVNIGDVGAALHLRDSLWALNSQQEPLVRSARDLRARDFRSGNYIVLGGSFANPWAHLLEQVPFNFQFQDRPGQSMVIVNHNPAPGEQSVYSSDDEGHGYARVALVPNLTRTGQALMIAGMSMESTEAAVDFCLSPDSMKLLSTLNVNGAGEVPPFEALLRTKKEGGTGVRAELIAVRLTPLELNP